MVTDWSRYGTCYTCGVNPGEACQNTRSEMGLLWRPDVKRPHRGRAREQLARLARTTKQTP